MKHWFLFFLSFIMSYQGILLGQNVTGTFENLTTILELRQDGTFYYKVKNGDLIHTSPICGADLISYGQWEKVGRKYVLFSDTTLKGPYLAAHVEESCNSTHDSLYIFISLFSLKVGISADTASLRRSPAIKCYVHNKAIIHCGYPADTPQKQRLYRI